MMKYFVLTGLLFSLYCSPLFAQDSLQATIVLIGDAGKLTPEGRHPVVEAVKKRMSFDKKTTVVYLGDNLYKTGLPDESLPTYEIAKAPLDSQIRIAGKSDSKVYFVPGNHDWANGGANGYESILRVQQYIDILGNKNVMMFPRDGCPGPEEVKINDDIVLIMMDSQWWLHEKDKPGAESDCPTKTKAEVLTQLGDMLAQNASKLVLFAFHHPLKSYGPHGGYFTLRQHIFPFTDMNKSWYFPLPVLGSVYPLTRAIFGTEQDLKHPLYQQMIKQVEPVVKSHPNVIFMGGHEHTLQMIQDSGYNYIVSGSGSKSSRVSTGKNSLFSSSKNGYVTLEVSKNKNVRVNFFTLEGDSVKNSFTHNILDFSKFLEVKDTMRAVEYAFKDTVVISASDQYKNFSGFKQTFLGDNYRKEWSEPVLFKEFNIRKEQGGFKILSMGGGKQTKSLKLEDKNGKEWSLRTVDKDPEKVVPPNLRGTIAQRIVQDMISAGHPYAPLVVPSLANSVGILAAQPKFFFVPDDPAFGIYRKMFANTIVMLEDRDPTPDGSDTKSTASILNKMYDDNDHHVDQEAVLKARLLDMLIADWDRHADQWKWGSADTGKGKLYYPVPRDRDQAFFNSDGLLLGFLSRKHIPFLQGFKKNVPDINWLNFAARDFDRRFMNSLDIKSWEATTDTFQRQITDEVIIDAVRKLPPEILKLDSAMLVSKLISRRNLLKEEALNYYNFISKGVTVTGSNKKEFFHITDDNGELKLSVYKKNDESDSATMMFRRTFHDDITKELVLYGLNGDDDFKIDDNVRSKIKVRIIGGKGEDSFDLSGNLLKKVYDLSTEKNVFVNADRTRKFLSPEPSILNYKNAGFEYDRFFFPLLNVGFNVEDKLLVGLGLSKRTYGFRKAPFATDQKLTTLFAVSRAAYQVKYKGIFNQVLFDNDIVVNAAYVSPTLNNFFGFGNSTVFDRSKSVDYYRVRYSYLQADIQVRKRVKDYFEISAGPEYYRYSSDFKNNTGRILQFPTLSTGKDSASIYSIKNYFGLKAKMDINYLNNEIFPSRGITWYTEFSSLRGLNSNSGNLTKLTSDMTIYASISDASRVTGVIRAGGGHIFSSNPEYFQALTLGVNNYVRGFRKNRFAGTSVAYTSAELRFKIAKSRSYLLPGDIGLIGYYDIGRVWQRGESSKKWHDTYGGGIYFVPYNVVMIAATMGISEEDQLFNFSLGTKLTLTF